MAAAPAGALTTASSHDHPCRMCPPSSTPDSEPRPAGGEIRFEEGDLHGLTEGCAHDPQFNDRRLVLRRKLLALGKRFVAGLGAGLGLEARSSLHHPHALNGGVVRRMWVSIGRGKAERRRLARELGPELGKDLDSAHRNAHLLLAVEPQAFEIAFRIRSEAWTDGRNLERRIEAEGERPLLALLRELEGFRARIEGWKGEWSCGSLEPEELREWLGYHVPGERGIVVERRWPAPVEAPQVRAAFFEPGVPDGLLEELARLLPLYRYAAWSRESDFLFGG